MKAIAQKLPHFELQAQYRMDKSQTAWTRYDKNSRWVKVIDPSWNPTREYHIGPTPPPDQPKMCELGGLQFPMPEIVAPEIGTEIYVAFNTGPQALKWRTGDLEYKWLELRLVHLSLQAAEQHSAAMRAANMQAVENAK